MSAVPCQHERCVMWCPDCGIPPPVACEPSAHFARIAKNLRHIFDRWDKGRGPEMLTISEAQWVLYAATTLNGVDPMVTLEDLK